MANEYRIHQAATEVVSEGAGDARANQVVVEAVTYIPIPARLHQIVVETLAGDLVDAPTGLSATALSTSQIDASWTDVATDEDAYELQYDTDSGFSSPTAIALAADATSKSVTGLTQGTTYYFRVRASRAGFPSAWSNTASATTLTESGSGQAPSAQSTLAVRPVALRAQLWERDFSSPLVHGLTLDVQDHAWHAIGGPDWCVVEAYGHPFWLSRLLRNLRSPLYLKDSLGGDVWWGYLEVVELHIGHITIGVTLDDMNNRVAVAYAAPASGSAPSGERQTTAWASDADSVSDYGQKDHLASLATASSDQATALRDRILSERALPLGTVTNLLSGGVIQKATLHGAGWWHSLDWRFYELDEGFESYEPEDTSGFWAHAIGQSGYSASTISFEDATAGDFVEDSANGLGQFIARQIIEISGAAQADNNGVKHCLRVRTDGSSLEVEEDNDTEGSGNSDTIAPEGQMLAMSFAAPADFRLHKVRIRARVVGSPTDNLQVALHADSSGEPAASATETASVAASDLTDAFAWAEFDFGDTSSLSNGTTYWLVISRSGSNHATNYFAVEVDESGDYGSGSVKLHDGASWGAPTFAADLPFVVVGSRETTAQIEDIVDTAGEFITGVDIEDASGLWSNPWRDGDGTALAEIEDLLASGTTNDRRLLAEVTRERRVRIYEEPAPSSDAWLLYTDGALHTQFDAPVLVHKAPVARWAKLKNLPSAFVNLTVLAEDGFVFIERSEYNARERRLQPYPKGASDPFALAESRDAHEVEREVKPFVVRWRDA